MIIPFDESCATESFHERKAIRLLITQSAQMRELVNDAVRAAKSSATILLTGESGTGKELFAKIIHENSRRSENSLVSVNCAALPASLIESELFGHERGAFTDAIGQRVGRFEYADGGTLLLDEITEIPLTTQAKLLRALEENEIQRIGSNESITTDIRVVATTNRDMAQQVAVGNFRLDLFHRLNVIEICIPPLRERTVDIPLLASYFIEIFRFENEVGIEGLTKAAMQLLGGYDWPGNIRELRNTIHRACVLTSRPLLDTNCFAHLSAKTVDSNYEDVPAGWLSLRLSEIEKRIILASISKYGSKRMAAESLGVTARTLANKLKLYSQLPIEPQQKAA